jgi:hypothetical protein
MCVVTASSDTNLNCNLTHQYWKLIVQVEDIKTKASIRVVQGIRLISLPQTNIGNPKALQKIQLKTVGWYQHN